MNFDGFHAFNGFGGFDFPLTLPHPIFFFSPSARGIASRDVIGSLAMSCGLDGCTSKSLRKAIYPMRSGTIFVDPLLGNYARNIVNNSETF